LNHAQTRKRKPIKPATALGFTSYLNKWLYPNLGDLPLSSVNNLVVRGLVTNMTKASVSPKMVSNVVQVVKMVVASAVNENGEQLHPRAWNHEFIDLPEVKDTRQPAHSIETMKAIAVGSEGREQMLYILLGASGLRFGEAFGLEIDKHISDDFSTLHIRQKVWNGRVQPFLKTENGVRDIAGTARRAVLRAVTAMSSARRRSGASGGQNELLCEAPEVCCDRVSLLCNRLISNGVGGHLLMPQGAVCHFLSSPYCT